MRRLGSSARAALATCVVLLGGSAAAEDTLLYYEQNGKVVITNTPSRRDVRPVPGFDEPKGQAHPRAALPSTAYDSFIEVVARENGLSSDLVKAVAMAESGFDPRALSPKGAQGIMQLMPATARRYGVRNAFDPFESLRGGAMHLRDLLDEFDGNVKLALAAYNAGSGAVRRHGGVPAYRETLEYVRKIESTLNHTGNRGRRRSAPPPAEAVRMIRGADGSITFDNIE